jgi:hypothetical protein
VSLRNQRPTLKATEYKNGDDTTKDDEEVDNDAELGTINIPDETTGPPSAHSNAGVGNSTSDKDNIDVKNAGVGGDDEETEGERDRAWHNGCPGDSTQSTYENKNRDRMTTCLTMNMPY